MNAQQLGRQIMNKKGLKVATCALVSSVLIAGFSVPSDAAMFINGLPVAGVALTLHEGKAVEVIQKEVAKMEVKESVSDNAIDSKLDNVILSVGEAAVAPVAPVDNMAVAQVLTEDPEAPVSELVVDSQGQEVVASVSGNEVLTQEEKEFSKLVIADVNDYVNIRNMPSEDGEVLGKLYDNSVGEFVSEQNGWYEITSGTVTGFVKAEYVVTGDAAIEMAKEVCKRIATVNTTTLRVRDGAGEDAAVVGLVPIEDELLVVEELDGWVKVDIEEGQGFVSTEFVDLSTEFVKAESKAEEEARIAKEEASRKAANAAASKKSGKSSKGEAVAVSGGSGAGSSVASFACQFVGNPYVYGGSSLTGGTDCSGFVMSVYANFGVGLPHSSGALRGVGADVGGIGNAQPGDIVCYSGHVGIYIGGGNIVHASTAATGIKISNASYKSILSVRRIF